MAARLGLAFRLQERSIGLSSVYRYPTRSVCTARVPATVGYASGYSTCCVPRRGGTVQEVDRTAAVTTSVAAWLHNRGGHMQWRGHASHFATENKAHSDFSPLSFGAGPPAGSEEEEAPAQPKGFADSFFNFSSPTPHTPQPQPAKVSLDEPSGFFEDVAPEDAGGDALEPAEKVGIPTGQHWEDAFGVQSRDKTMYSQNLEDPYAHLKRAGVQPVPVKMPQAAERNDNEFDDECRDPLHAWAPLQDQDELDDPYEHTFEKRFAFLQAGIPVSYATEPTSIQQQLHTALNHAAVNRVGELLDDVAVHAACPQDLELALDLIGRNRELLNFRGLDLLVFVHCPFSPSMFSLVLCVVPLNIAKIPRANKIFNNFKEHPRAFSELVRGALSDGVTPVLVANKNSLPYALTAVATAYRRSDKRPPFVAIHPSPVQMAPGSGGTRTLLRVVGLSPEVLPDAYPRKDALMGLERRITGRSRVVADGLNFRFSFTRDATESSKDLAELLVHSSMFTRVALSLTAARFGPAGLISLVLLAAKAQEICHTMGHQVVLHLDKAAKLTESEMGLMMVKIPSVPRARLMKNQVITINKHFEESTLAALLQQCVISKSAGGVSIRLVGANNLHTALSCIQRVTRRYISGDGKDPSEVVVLPVAQQTGSGVCVFHLNCFKADLGYRVHSDWVPSTREVRMGNRGRLRVKAVPPKATPRNTDTDRLRVQPISPVTGTQQ